MTDSIGLFWDLDISELEDTREDKAKPTAGSFYIDWENMQKWTIINLLF